MLNELLVQLEFITVEGYGMFLLGNLRWGRV